MPDENIEIVDHASNPYVFLPRNLLERGLSYRAIVAYMAIGIYGGATEVKNGNIHLKELAEITNVSKDTIRRGLKELKDNGLTGDFYVDIASGK